MFPAELVDEERELPPELQAHPEEERAEPGVQQDDGPLLVALRQTRRHVHAQLRGQKARAVVNSKQTGLQDDPAGQEHSATPEPREHAARLDAERRLSTRYAQREVLRENTHDSS